MPRLNSQVLGYMAQAWAAAAAARAWAAAAAARAWAAATRRRCAAGWATSLGRGAGAARRRRAAGVCVRCAGWGAPAMSLYVNDTVCVCVGGVVCIPTLERVALCDRQRLLCRRDGLVRQVLCVGGDARGVRRGPLLDHVLGLPHLLAIGEGDGLSIQVSEAAPILELERARREASPATTMHTEEGHVGIKAASIAGGHFPNSVNRLRTRARLSEGHHATTPCARSTSVQPRSDCPSLPNPRNK